jgi:hypothetical protein
VLWNAADAGAAEAGRIDLRASLCFALPEGELRPGAVQLDQGPGAAALVLVMALLALGSGANLARRC